MKARLAVIASLAVLTTMVYLVLSIIQAIKDFHDDPEAFWE